MTIVEAGPVAAGSPEPAGEPSESHGGPAEGAPNRTELLAATYRPGPDVPALARRQFFYTAQRTELDALAREELLIVVSELCANAYVHGDGPIGLRVWGEDDEVVVEVTDNGRWSRYGGRTVALDSIAERGRGLDFVNGVCDGGIVLCGPSGTTVRCWKSTGEAASRIA